jgi:uncharacterized protein
MKIIFDIGHPAHVHYFRNLISILKNRGNSILIIARNKDVSLELLNNYKLEYISRGKGSNSVIGKTYYLLRTLIFMLILTRKFKPNLFISFNSPYLSIVSKLTNVNHLCFNDTEHAKIGNLITSKFSDYLVTPDCFLKNYHKRHIKFKSYMELSYLSPKYFKPDKNIFNEINYDINEKYIIFRFVSWKAAHDFGHKGLDLKTKMELINSLKKYARIFISSESKLPDEMMKYKLDISAEKIHSILKYASLYIGEGATMASECAALGTPAIYINDLNAGTLIDQSSRGLIYHFESYSKDIIKTSKSLLNDKDLLINHKEKHAKMLNEKIDLTHFMVKLVNKFV